jgi:lambda family phage minor tail protein L
MAVGTEGDLQKPTPPAQVELFILDPNPISSREDPPVVAPLFYFFNGTDEDGTPVVFRGDSYLPIPLEANGFAAVGPTGTLPHPKMKIANANGYVSGLLRSYRDLIGARLTRLVTYEPYLDGHAEADPLKKREETDYVVFKLLQETKFEIEWELRHKSDQPLQFPRKQIGPICANTVTYRGVDCGWAGANFDINDVKEGDPGYTGVDECAKRLGSCRCRWQETDDTVVMPFGGYPGVARPIS